MPDGKTVRSGDAERIEVVRQDLIKAKGTVARGALQLGKTSDDNAGELLKRSDQPQMREHTVHPVQVFTDVLEKKNGSCKLGKVWRAHQTLQQCQVATDEGAFSDAGAQRHNSVFGGYQLTHRHGQASQTTSEGISGQDQLEVPATERGHGGARHGAVKGDDTCHLGDRVQERGNIGETDDDLGAA